MCRFALIPFFFWTYTTDKFLAAAIIFFAAGLTDMIDGMIARRYNMTTELGKIIDPLADKLMQMCAVVLLAIEFKQLIWLLVLFCVKEITQMLGGFKMIKDKKEIMPSKWYGKLNTAIIFVFLSLLIWRGYGIEGHVGYDGNGIPEWICYIAFGIIAFLLVYSFIRYYIEGFRGAYKKSGSDEKTEEDSETEKFETKETEADEKAEDNEKTAEAK